jgi:hypothetical protein
MLDITGTELATTWAATARTTRPKLEIQCDGVNWVDESAHLVGVGSCALQCFDPATGLPALGRSAPGSLSLTLANEDQRYSPTNASGALYAYIQNGFERVPVRLSMGLWNGTAFEYARRFTGYLQTPRGDLAANRLTLTAMDGAHRIYQLKRDTPLYLGYRADEILAAELTAAGVTAQTLARGLHLIPAVWLESENLWEHLQKLAQADAGLFYFDCMGNARFAALDSWLLDSGVVAATFDASDYWQADTKQAWDDAYTGVTVEYAPLGGIGRVIVYQSTEAIELAPSETRDIEARLQYGVTGLYEIEEDDDYTAVSSGGMSMSPWVSVSATANAQAATITLANAHPYQRAYILGLVLRGHALYGDESQKVTRYADDAILTSHWRGAGKEAKVFRPTANDYVQTAPQATILAQYLIDRLQQPPQLVHWKARACPFLELGDRVHVEHAPSGFDSDCYLLGYNESWANDGAYDAEYWALPVASMYRYTDYFIAGASSYAYVNCDRTFY